MEAALGPPLQWTPETFWRSTPHELMTAIDAFNKQYEPDAMTQDELDSMARRFPDKKVA